MRRSAMQENGGGFRRAARSGDAEPRPAPPPRPALAVRAPVHLPPGLPHKPGGAITFTVSKGVDVFGLRRK
ncbi:hypothetical protein [Roseomonas sp. BN140053]|uniref:hypothetical protein n=1 Tax=Roseomonas sp. BN140053 TaxID=3391898 RepID=UPI0039E749E6